MLLGVDHSLLACGAWYPVMGILSNLRRGALEYCILAMLTERELYGLEIARRLTADGVLMSSEGTLYPLLARLRRAGLVDTTWQESVEGPPGGTTP